MKRTAIALLSLCLITAAFTASAPAGPTDAGLLQSDDRTSEPDYRSAEDRVFKDLYAPNVKAWFLVEPSFRIEYAVGLSVERGRYKAFVLEPSDQIWQFILLDALKRGEIRATGASRAATAADIKELEARLPPRPEDLKISRCELPVPPAIADRVLQAWRLMLARTAPLDNLGVDGTTYHFGLRGGGTGQTWNPNPNTNPQRLALIAIALRDACKTMSAASLSSIPALADAIVANQK